MLTYEYIAQGRKHQQKGIPCQDHCIAFDTTTGGFFIAVADGVSSSPHSELASLNATKALKEFWETYSYPYETEAEIRSGLYSSFNYALRKSKESQLDALPPDALETTLTAVYLTRKGIIYGLHVGDSAAWMISEDKKLTCLTIKQRDPEGSVAALSSDSSEWQFFKEKDKAKGILLVTDGLQEVMELNPEQGLNNLIRYSHQATISRNEKRDLTNEELFHDINDDITYFLLLSHDIDEESGQETDMAFPTEEKTPKSEEAASNKGTKEQSIEIKGNRDDYSRINKIPLFLSKQLSIILIVIVCTIIAFLFARFFITRNNRGIPEMEPTDIDEEVIDHAPENKETEEEVTEETSENKETEEETEQTTENKNPSEGAAEQTTENKNPEEDANEQVPENQDSKKEDDLHDIIEEQDPTEKRHQHTERSLRKGNEGFIRTSTSNFEGRNQNIYQENGHDTF